MTGHDPDHDNVLKELDAALQVEPSRAFADGVRARVSRSQVRTRQMWWGLAAAASIVLATVTFWRPSTPVPAMVSVDPVQVPAPIVSPAPTELVVPVKRATANIERNVRPVVRVAGISKTDSEPRLEVITNQRTLLRELWAGVGTGGMVETVVEATPVTAAEVKPITPIVWDPIVVPPIVVTEVGRVPGSSGTPVIRRMTATKETR